MVSYARAGPSTKPFLGQFLCDWKTVELVFIKNILSLIFLLLLTLICFYGNKMFKKGLETKKLPLFFFSQENAIH
jgi:hypothetical protein